MSTLVLYKLLAIMAAVAIGYVAGRMRWLGRPEADPARVLSAAAFYIFVPALLFRTTARVDLGALPWRMLAAYFLPALALMLLTHAWHKRRRRQRDGIGAAAPSVRAISVSFGNSVQIGIPMVTAIFGEAGLALHLILVSLHALVLLSVATALVELDLASEQARDASALGLWRTLTTTVRNTVLHPVVLPVLVGLGWNLLGLGLPGPLDEGLQLLGSAVVPLCLVLIGLSLAYSGTRGHVRGAIGVALAKLLLLPALVLAVAHWGFGLTGLPLSVMVLMASAPVGANALVFAQRYQSMEAETTTAIVLSTLAFMLTVPLWLGLLARLNG